MNAQVLDLQFYRRDAYGYVAGSCQLAEEFHKVVSGNNFITPEILGYVRIKGGVAELSTGPKFLDMGMFGVTAVINGVKSKEHGGNFNSRKEAEDHIRTLI